MIHPLHSPVVALLEGIGQVFGIVVVVGDVGAVFRTNGQVQRAVEITFRDLVDLPVSPVFEGVKNPSGMVLGHVGDVRPALTIHRQLRFGPLADLLNRPLLGSQRPARTQ